MKVGDLVRYCNDLIRRTETPWIGLIVYKDDTWGVLVQWNNGARQWRDSDVLEVVSESR